MGFTIDMSGKKLLDFLMIKLCEGRVIRSEGRGRIRCGGAEDKKFIRTNQRVK